MPEGPPYRSAQDVPRGTPTPTQDELDKIALEEHPEISPDGTPQDPNVMQLDPRQTKEQREEITRRQITAERTTAPRVTSTPAQPKP